MLWKYKKCYQETNEDIVISPKTCYQINSVYYIQNEGAGETIGINFLTCNDSSFESYDIADNATLNFSGKCITSNSLILTVGGVPGFLITDLEIANAILYNSGFLAKNYSGGESVLLAFSECM